MNFKKFLKPDWRKIVLMIILIFLSFLYYRETIELHEYNMQSEIRNYGLPFPYYTRRCGWGVPMKAGVCMIETYYYSNSFINIISWYFLSCFIIWIYEKLKKRS